MQLDNHDAGLRYFELMLEANLADLPGLDQRSLPAGFHFEQYAPGDEADWIAIEMSAKELTSEEQGRQVWQRYYGGREAELPRRMFFVADAAGQKVGTATAFYDIRRPDDGVNGMLHWVAVRRERQGLGLAKPLITRALRQMRSLGYTRAVIPTQTTTWLACKVYLDLGFRPIPQNAVHSRDGWRMIRAITNHPALAAFDPLPEEEWRTKK